ncbi:SusD/RagB family nutrient-binding outer membrane lipoprotein [Chitinophaga polysaccharea]|uniref:SusD/RagB family nutrient-binding outer membrane lipoprotein n=1 Tax=Chitinophaga TaxID=79328 RepID=UPI00145572FE|nr:MULTISPECIES: SusD/RagB family nutrient-binding outer membrane lipoprotein [Chitinophaga]NLR58285.1 SusD/RagB family nutrient-binding outer membrane lipoprotein [Chitinophaga polysaccharea]NLU90811.1 SusD/RagB family nutrient-binding outer membrane lipoprotein [Chitinophaga sp. Ak27]
MNKTKKIFLYIAGVSMTLGACTKDFQDINTTPGLPTTTTVPPMVNGVISTLFLKGQEQAAIHNEYYYPITQLATISGNSGYLVQNGASDIWNDYYAALQNINQIQDKINAYTGDKAEMDNIQGITYILKAYKTLRISDQFGDMPYSKAGLAYTNESANFRPAYDSQESIYKTTLDQLKWASQHLTTAANTPGGKPYVTLGSSETLFNNSITMWQKFGNSLLLRYAMQIVEKDPATATPYLQYALSGIPLIGEHEDAGMWPQKLNNYVLNDSRFWSFTSHKFVRMSTTCWNMLADGTADAQIFDPRAKLFFETNQAGKWAPLAPGSTASDNTNPYQDKRDADFSNKDNCVFSPVNYLLVRDIYYQPELFMTAAEVHFLKAEAYARGLGVNKDMVSAGNEYFSGITSSVNFWDSIAHTTNVTNDNWSAVAPPSPTAVQMAALFANPKVAFTGTDDQKLNKIYAQEWLSFFRQPWLAYNLWRRTGRTPRDGNPAAYVNFNRLQYPQQESVNNTANYNDQANRMGGNSTTVKVWWMK